MTAYNIRILGPADGRVEWGKNVLWLAQYDAEAQGGRGYIKMTADRDNAMRFTDMRAALECYRRVPINLPTRDDGRPNRPLTAYSIEVLASDAEPLPL